MNNQLNEYKICSRGIWDLSLIHISETLKIGSYFNLIDIKYILNYKLNQEAFLLQIIFGIIKQLIEKI